MKNLLKVFAAFFMFMAVLACDEKTNTNVNTAALQNISPNYIYFFYQNSCPHCHHAAGYISKKYPNLRMINLDVRKQENYGLFLKCAQKFRLNGNTLGTPLICMGDHYIMGWSDIEAKKFDSYVQRFK